MLKDKENRGPRTHIILFIIRRFKYEKPSNIHISPLKLWNLLSHSTRNFDEIYPKRKAKQKQI